MKKCFRGGIILFLISSILLSTVGCGNSIDSVDSTNAAESSKNEVTLTNHMTEKELSEAEKTDFQLLNKPWETASDTSAEAAGEYSSVQDKIYYCEGYGSIIYGELNFNAMPPKDYDGGAGETEFCHMDAKTGDVSFETLEFASVGDAKEKIRAAIDEDIANGYQKVPADRNYESIAKLYDAVIDGDVEIVDSEFIHGYMDIYYALLSSQDSSDSMYWEMDEEKVESIKESIDEYHLYDEELDEGFVVHVITPPEYDSAVAYPTLVMTDAVWRFNDVTSLYDEMISKRAEPQILITIGFEYNIDGWDNEVRGNILCDHKKEFLDFITDNMMPYLAENYSFDYEASTLFGHSQGGVFTHYAAFNFDKYENKPFKNYIIGSPVFWTPYFTDVSDYEDYKNEYGYFDRNSSYDRNLLITAGSDEDEDYEEYFGENDSTLEGVEHLKNRLDEYGVTTYEVKIYESHHYQYVPEMLLEYILSF